MFIKFKCVVYQVHNAEVRSQHIAADKQLNSLTPFPVYYSVTKCEQLIVSELDLVIKFNNR